METWHYTPNRLGMIKDDAGKVVAIVYGAGGSCDDQKTMDERARLIVAAREMREALEWVAEAHVPDQPAAINLDEANYVRRWVGIIRAHARAAIAKSRGDA